MSKFLRRGGLSVLALAFCIFFCGYYIAKGMYNSAAFQALLSGISFGCFVFFVGEDD